MTLVTLTNHPGMQLESGAAASLARFERAHGIQPLTSTYRSVESQQVLIDRWDRGGPLNRPPYLYAPRRPASSGLHTKGTALDTEAPDVFRAHGAEYGWRFLYAYDKVHFEYDSAYDQHRNESFVEKTETLIPYTDNKDNMYSRIPVGNTMFLFNHVTGKRTPIPSKDGTVDYHKLIQRALNNNGGDPMNARELDLVAQIMSRTF